MYNNSYDGWKDRTPIRAFSLPSVYVYSVYVSVSVSVSVSDGSVSVSDVAELRLLTDPCLIKHRLQGCKQIHALLLYISCRLFSVKYR